MNERERKQLRAKASDYKAYSLVLFAVSVLFYLGTIIPHALEAAKKPFVLIAIVVFLAASIYFSRCSAACLRKLDDEDEVSL
ncbi:YrhC family protein [Anoxybacteroides tepidamans]|uniref:YrhC family protein n=1 Tax=Anoxybacteroides tepidamans TaxID=265948 RepID=UPI00048646DC|nr:YrhC family protein [Anoxybacillus tepidamans]